MPEQLVTIALSVIGTAAVIFGAILTYRVGKRTVQATEKRDAHARDDALINQYRGSWEAEVEARRNERADRERLEQKFDELRDKVEAYRTEVRGLRNEVERFKRWLTAAVAYIRELLAWAATVTHPVPHPPIPHEIADLINNTDKP